MLSRERWGTELGWGGQSLAWCVSSTVSDSLVTMRTCWPGVQTASQPSKLDQTLLFGLDSSQSDTSGIYLSIVLVWNDLPEGIKGDMRCHTFPFSGSLSFFGRRLFLGQWFSQDILSGSTERPWGVKAKAGEVVWWGYLPYFNHNCSIFLFPLYILGSALQFL